MKKALSIIVFLFACCCAFSQSKMKYLGDTIITVNSGQKVKVECSSKNELWIPAKKEKNGDVHMEYINAKTILLSCNCTEPKKVVFARYLQELDDYPLLDVPRPKTEK